MAKLEKAVCGRCGGSGHFSFNLKDGTRCYGCGGSGFVMVDPVKVARNLAAKEKRAAKTAAEREARIAAANEFSVEIETKYKNDPRIGPKTRVRCESFPAVADETYRALAYFDVGSMPNGRQVHPSVIGRFAE